MTASRPQSKKAARPTISSRTRSSVSSSSGSVPSTSKFSVVGIGASAGGLETCRKFFAALPPETGLAYILVQHLDPNHKSMMVDLLSGFTKMPVLQATNNMPLRPEHLYVIPPGCYLSVQRGALCLTAPQVRHGARLPFDFLLHSLAQEYREKAIAIILSGTGSDGSIGMRALKEMGGLVIAQEPSEAEYEGMPRNAILTGAVDLILNVANMPAALVQYVRRMAMMGKYTDQPSRDEQSDWLPTVIDLLRTTTPHDFRLYKPGTLRRRVERRMAITDLKSDNMEGYLQLLRSEPEELSRLAKDLLINVTGFFRDPKVFEYLAEVIVPELVAKHAADKSLRIWVAGCSTGEEAYSLAILFHEYVTSAKIDIKLHIFASDTDPEAVACAREGFYPNTIQADITTERLERYFQNEDDGYRVTPLLREMVIFTVQDLLTDPPFSRLDMISCRNLLIYLQPEAQAKVISLFHFALRDAGILLLGSAETVGTTDDRFTFISKPHQLYRQTGRRRFGDFGFPVTAGDTLYVPTPQGLRGTADKRAALANRCQQLVLDSYAPAAVLINQKRECLYTLGPTERYLHVVSGHPTHDLLAMVQHELRATLRSAIQQAAHEKVRITAEGRSREKAMAFSIAIEPVSYEGENLMLVCFIDRPSGRRAETSTSRTRESRKADLERELDETRAELQGALRSLEISYEEQKAINEEALSVSEEFQSTNEELLTSKEELQSLNEELTALNSQLQETLEQQRTTSNDLQNVLYSTDVATLFLDPDFNIRFFTPATKMLFSVIPSDVGRPIADLRTLATDETLLADAARVMDSQLPVECEVETQTGVWYARRILPYRNHQNGIEGVVITFIDISERKHSAEILEAARRQAERANVAKSRFLAAASHDLRQPLQTLVLLQGLLAKMVEGEQAGTLVKRLEEALGAMSGMLNVLLDINQIEAGTVRIEMSDFLIEDLLDQLRNEFNYQATAHGLAFHAVPCGLVVHSDPRLLEQMLRNILSNAVKYTKTGKILLGCRRHGSELSIEIWDTGVGIPDTDLEAIFDEYHQLGNAIHKHSHGLGLGLAIVQRLGNLLDHSVHVRSSPGKGSVFTIRVPLGGLQGTAPLPQYFTKENDMPEKARRDTAVTNTILVVEDDPTVRELLQLFLTKDGYRVVVAADGAAASKLVFGSGEKPALILADYNLPLGVSGLQLATDIRDRLQGDIPVVILTGDISTATLRDIARHNCLQLNKPVKTDILSRTIKELLETRQTAKSTKKIQKRQAARKTDEPVIFVVDDDSHLRDSIQSVLEEDGLLAETFVSSEAFISAYRPGREACLLVDAKLPGMSGIELLERLHHADHQLPAIMITGCGDVKMAVQAMKAGAHDFIEKPIGREEILASVRRALEQGRNASALFAWHATAAEKINDLTPRQRQVMELVLAGHPNKNIAADLGISQRTVENHRASVMKRTGVKSLPALARLAIAAAEHTESHHG